MANKTYSEKLKDPRWQRLRLEVMQRDEFKCRWCLDGSKTLNVHHLEYNGDPWDTPIEHLITICEECHKDDHEFRKTVEADFLRLLRLKGYSYDHIISMIYAVKEAKSDSPWLISEVIAHTLTNQENINQATDKYFGR